MRAGQTFPHGVRFGPGRTPIRAEGLPGKAQTDAPTGLTSHRGAARTCPVWSPDQQQWLEQAVRQVGRPGGGGGGGIVGQGTHPNSPASVHLWAVVSRIKRVCDAVHVDRCADCLSNIPGGHSAAPLRPSRPPRATLRPRSFPAPVVDHRDGEHAGALAGRGPPCGRDGGAQSRPFPYRCSLFSSHHPL